MSKEEVEKLFSQSTAASVIPKAVRSTGFGLYLTRLLIESQDGRISCASVTGKGTIFGIILPVQK